MHRRIVPNPRARGFGGTAVRVDVPSGEMHLQGVAPWLRDQELLARLLRARGQCNIDKTRITHVTHVENGWSGAGFPKGASGGVRI